GLFEYLWPTASIRIKKDCFAVRCPRVWDIHILIECKPPGGEQLRAVARLRTDVNARHPILPQKDQYFPICTGGKLRDRTVSLRDMLWGAGSFSGLRQRYHPQA